MNNYNNDGHGKGRGGFKGKSSFGGGRGGDRGGRGGRGGERSGGGERRTGGRSMETFKAECSKCHKSCTLPFKPNGQKPVFCSECFEKQGDGGGRYDDRGGRGDYDKPPRSERKPRHDRPASTPVAVAPNRELMEMKQQLDKIENRLNRILDLINPPTPPTKKAAPVAETPAAVKKTVKKVVTKKAPAKKVAKKAVKKTVKKVAKKAVKKTTKTK